VRPPSSSGGRLHLDRSYDREAAFFRGCLSGIEARAEELGVNLTVTLSGYNPTKQIAQIETAIQQQPDALINSRLRREAIMCGVARWRAFVWRRPDPR
jgi:ABC-type sugar transport system substrate-binding protein